MLFKERNGAGKIRVRLSAKMIGDEVVEATIVSASTPKKKKK